MYFAFFMPTLQTVLFCILVWPPLRFSSYYSGKIEVNSFTVFLIFAFSLTLLGLNIFGEKK